MIAIPQNPPNIVENSRDSIRTELEAMFEADQHGRFDIEAAQVRHGSASPEVADLWKKQHSTDEKNRKRLAEIIEQSGWPKLSLVGEKAALSAFAVLQHADLDFKKRCLPRLRAAAESGEAKLKWLAFLEDRVLVGEGKKQLYGTQLIDSGSGNRLEPIEDEANVDERRAKMGLGPLAEYLKGFGIEYRIPTKLAPNLPLKSDPACITFRSLSTFRYLGSARRPGAGGAA